MLTLIRFCAVVKALTINFFQKNFFYPMHDADFPKIPRVKLEEIDLYRLSPVHIEMSKTNQLKKIPYSSPHRSSPDGGGYARVDGCKSGYFEAPCSPKCRDLHSILTSQGKGLAFWVHLWLTDARILSWNVFLLVIVGPDSYL
jgi:hypothetical protein